MNARSIQLICLVIMIAATAVSGRMLGPILRQSEAAGLRYADVSVEGAPPFVALGTAIGALRGLIVDFLWIKVHIMKEKGLFYEVMADADLITKLQPRFAAVWAFHGHNMAYNISVATQTVEERWEWVNAGIRLVRGEGLRHNPNDLVLHKELAFWFAHKIEGYSDDAHLFYKRMFCREWHFVLGRPPESLEERIAWIQAIADAPSTLGEAEREAPGVLALVERLDTSLTPFGESQEYKASREFLGTYGMWVAVTEQSAAAEILGVREQMAARSPFFRAFDEIAGDPDPAVQKAWNTLIRYTRKRVLIDEYNMDPQLMYEYTRDLGPIDWRNAQAHALYWARRGSQLGETRVARENDIYKIVNNDRLQLQALQGLARYGRMSFDPFSTELPARFPDKRWVDEIETMFEEMYVKHYGTRGAGGDTFIAFLENFMASAVREAYRSGEFERADRLYAKLDERLGRGSDPPSHKYAHAIGDFIAEEVKGEYAFQPNLAPSEAAMSLRYAFREGVGRDQKEIYDNALEFVDMVIKYFKGNEYNDYVTRFGEGRMKSLISDLEHMRQIAFLQLMTDPTVTIEEKQTLWTKIDKYEPRLRLEVYDAIQRPLRSQFASSERSRAAEYDDVFPAPPGLELYRRQIALERARREQEAEAAKQRDEFERQ